MILMSWLGLLFKSAVLDDHPVIVSVRLPCCSVLGMDTVLTTPDTSPPSQGWAYPLPQTMPSWTVHPGSC